MRVIRVLVYEGNGKHVKEHLEKAWLTEEGCQRQCRDFIITEVLRTQDDQEVESE